jgi:very-short-patch-repair endonuclease
MNRKDFEAELATRGNPWGSTPTYTMPTYESPIEQQLGMALAPILITTSVLATQVPITTMIGEYRPDFLLWTKGRVTAIECDGADFHTDKFADDLRDAALLQTGLIDKVVRFEGVLLHHHPNDAAMMMSVLHSEAFDERGRAVAERRSNRCAHRYTYVKGGVSIPMPRDFQEADAEWYPEDDLDIPPSEQTTESSFVTIHHLRGTGAPTPVQAMADMISAGIYTSKEEIMRVYRPEWLRLKRNSERL